MDRLLPGRSWDSRREDNGGDEENSEGEVVILYGVLRALELMSIVIYKKIRSFQIEYEHEPSIPTTKREADPQFTRG